MMFFWLIIIGVLLYLVFGGNIDLTFFHKKSSSDLLDERLAKGEINIEEYREIKTVMKENEK